MSYKNNPDDRTTENKYAVILVLIGVRFLPMEAAPIRTELTLNWRSSGKSFSFEDRLSVLELRHPLTLAA